MASISIAPEMRFGRWTVLAAGPSKGRNRCWLCRCDCGHTERLVHESSLKSGSSRGCLHCRNLKHDGWLRPEYRIWIAIKMRCKSHSPYYEGVTFWPAWDADFAAFFAAVGPRPSPKHSIDRYPNPHGNYEPGNVRWATRAEQSRNLRRNYWLTYHGETMVREDWAKRVGMNSATLRNRLRRGWSLERALTEPVYYGRHD